MIFYGNCPAIVTPFKNNTKEIDYDAFKRLIDYLIYNGVSAITFLGTTGESATLSKEEKISIVKFAKSYIKDKIPIIVGAGSNSTKEAIANGIEFEKLGASALLYVTPYYNKCTQKGLVKHFTQIANNVHIPIILYNVPSRTGVNIQPQTTIQLSKHKNIVAIKEASGNLEQVCEIIRQTDDNFCVYSGDDNLTYPIMCLGGKGVISVVGNILPHKVTMLCNAIKNNNHEQARKIHYELYPITKMLFCEVNPIPIKSALSQIRLIKNEIRLPLTKMSIKNKNKLIKEMQKFHLV